jgi:hypothetical protein
VAAAPKPAPAHVHGVTLEFTGKVTVYDEGDKSTKVYEAKEGKTASQHLLPHGTITVTPHGGSLNITGSNLKGGIKTTAAVSGASQPWLESVKKLMSTLST